MLVSLALALKVMVALALCSNAFDVDDSAMWMFHVFDCVVNFENGLCSPFLPQSFSVFLCLVLFVCLFFFFGLLLSTTSSKQTLCRHIFLLRVCVRTVLYVCSCRNCM